MEAGVGSARGIISLFSFFYIQLTSFFALRCIKCNVPIYGNFSRRINAGSPQNSRNLISRAPTPQLGSFHKFSASQASLCSSDSLMQTQLFVCVRQFILIFENKEPKKG